MQINYYTKRLKLITCSLKLTNFMPPLLLELYQENLQDKY